MGRKKLLSTYFFKDTLQQTPYSFSTPFKYQFFNLPSLLNNIFLFIIYHFNDFLFNQNLHYSFPFLQETKQNTKKWVVDHHAIVLKPFQAVLFQESKLCDRIFEEILIPKAPKWKTKLWQVIEASEHKQWQTKLELPNTSPQRDPSVPPLGIAPIHEELPLRIAPPSNPIPRRLDWWQWVFDLKSQMRERGFRFVDTERARALLECWRRERDIQVRKWRRW